jgi:neutral ceramidase
MNNLGDFSGGEEMGIWIKTVGCPSVCAVMLAFGGAQAADWKAGVARVDTTPTTPMRMAGYASRTSPSEGVAHPLAAKALALVNGSGRRIVIVTCDIIGFRRSFTNRVAERVRTEYGLPREDFVLFASHNHAGPALVEPEEPDGRKQSPRVGFENNVLYTRQLEDKIVAIIGQALEKTEPVSLSFGVGRCHFALNRREPTASGIKLGKNPTGPTDEGVPILRVQTASGKPLAIIFGYACHNTTLRPDMMKIAADFAGYAQDRIEADYPGALALFVTGCAGDADPHPFGTLDLARRHGDELGEAVKLVLDHPTWLMNVIGPLRTAFAETAIRFAGPTDRASYEKRLNDPNQARRSHARRMIEAIDGGQSIRAQYPSYSVHAIAFGDRLTLIALSGEVVVDYAIRLQNELGGEGKTLWVAAYANDVIGYIPSARVLKERGYEAGDAYYGSTWPTPLAEDIETIVVNAAHEAVQKVRAK